MRILLFRFENKGVRRKQNSKSALSQRVHPPHFSSLSSRIRIMDDRIRINGLHLLASVLGSAWPSKDTGDARQAELQPVIVSIDIHHDLESACRLDDISHSVDYSRLSKKIRDACITPGSQELTPEMPYDLAERILDSCLKEINQPVQQVVVELEFPKLVLRAKCAGVTLIWTSGESTSKKHGFFIKELLVQIGRAHV